MHFVDFIIRIHHNARSSECQIRTHTHTHTHIYIYIYTYIYTGYTQKNDAVSKVYKKFISHLTQSQRTPSAAATVQVSRALPAVRFSCLLRGRWAAGPVSKVASQQEKAFCVLRFEVSGCVSCDPGRTH